MKLRFTIRDWFWLMLVLAMGMGWWIQNSIQQAAYRADLDKRDEILRKHMINMRNLPQYPAKE